MRAQETAGRTLRLASSELPEAERVPFWREVFGRKIAHVDIEPAADAPFSAAATMWALPGLRLHVGEVASPVRFSRTREFLTDGNDDLALLVNVAGTMAGRYRDQDIPWGTGDAVLFSHTEPSSVMHGASAIRGLIIERQGLAPLVRDLDDRIARRIPRDTDALRLLNHYLDGAALDGLSQAAPNLQWMFVTHIYDLVALMLGTTQEGSALAKARGGRAAKLQVLKTDIIGNLGNGDLSVGACAQRHNMTPRHVHRLFESEGTTFSQFVLGARLARAHRMLADPLSSHLTITEIALSAGFGDLSYFNRVFRRRHGGSPSEIRRALERFPTDK